MPRPRKPVNFPKPKTGAPVNNVAVLFQTAYRAHQAGQLDTAVTGYRQVLVLDQKHADAAYMLGVIRQYQGAPQEAEMLFRQALAVREDWRFLYSLANLFYQHKAMPQAEAAYRRVIALQPEYVDGYISLGTLLKETGYPAEAEAAFQRAIALKPDSVDAYYNFGNLLKKFNRFAEAESAYRRAVAIKPDFYQAHYNLANLLKSCQRSQEAEAAYRRTLALRPQYTDAHNNLGLLLRETGQVDAALLSCRKAIELVPDNYEAHLNYGILLLQTGDFAQGWPEYEYRWKIGVHEATPDFAQARWQGEELAGKTILLYAEQGLGDTLQFIRYAPLVAARGAVVYLLVSAALKNLVSHCDDVAAVFVPGDTLPHSDYQCPLLSLPLLFGTTLQTIPASQPYLAASPQKILSWQETMGEKTGLRVGLVWAGDPRKHLPWAQLIDRQRSIHFDTLHPILDVPGIEFFSLQLGDTAQQLNGHSRVRDLTADIVDFEDTAALVANLDLVISVDTSVAHLVGAIGKPLWLLNRYNTCWRWLMGRTDSPWYPSMRIFRQPTLGDWGSVVQDVRLALEQQSGMAP